MCIGIRAFFFFKFFDILFFLQNFPKNLAKLIDFFYQGNNLSKIFPFKRKQQNPGVDE
jgi:hypothetical protein